MDKTTISKLFADAAKQLRAEFEYVRASSPHSAEKGGEVESILKSFLNLHLPQRFRAVSGIIIDNDNNISRQTDLIIHDALSSPIYRSGDRTQIIPIDTVAAVIEVKTSLNKREIEDALEKIVVCKRLQKSPLTEFDQKPTGSEFSSVGTLGIIFGFDSNTSIAALGKNLAKIQNNYESNEWADMLVVLDKGLVDYGISYPGAENIAGLFFIPQEKDFPPPPFAVHLIVHEDAEFSLNRFFCNSMTHLIFYPRRPGNIPFKVILDGSNNIARTISAYQFNTKRRLVSVPSELYIENRPEPPLKVIINDENENLIGIIQFIPWQDGGVIRWLGSILLQDMLSHILHEKALVVPDPYTGGQLSSVLEISEAEFMKRLDIFAKRSRLICSYEK